MNAEEIRRKRVEAFRTLASEELDAARLLRKSHPAQAAYFLQQAVEKLLRGLLEMQDVPTGPTHNIQMLASMLKDSPEWVKKFDAVDELSVAATRYRYPGPKGNLSSMDEGRLRFLFEEVEKLDGEFGAVLETFAKGHSS